ALSGRRRPLNVNEPCAAIAPNELFEIGRCEDESFRVGCSADACLARPRGNARGIPFGLRKMKEMIRAGCDASPSCRELPERYEAAVGVVGAVFDERRPFRGRGKLSGRERLREMRWATSNRLV